MICWPARANRLPPPGAGIEGGVGSLLELLSAEDALASARAQRIQARLGWQAALVQLARDAGLLDLQGRSPLRLTARLLPLTAHNDAASPAVTSLLAARACSAAGMSARCAAPGASRRRGRRLGRAAGCAGSLAGDRDGRAYPDRRGGGPGGWDLERVTFREGDEVQVGQAAVPDRPAPLRGGAGAGRGGAGPGPGPGGERGARPGAVRGSRGQGEYVTRSSWTRRGPASVALMRNGSGGLAAARPGPARSRPRLGARPDHRPGGRPCWCKRREPGARGGGQPLVVINQMAPILVRFAVPATELPGIRRWRHRAPVVAVTGRGDTPRPEPGAVIPRQCGRFADRDHLLKASFPNRDAEAVARGPGAGAADGGHREGGARGAGERRAHRAAGVIGLRGGGQRPGLPAPGHRTRTTDSLAVLWAGALTAGEQVVTMGQVRITDGARVQVVLAPSGRTARGQP